MIKNNENELIRINNDIAVVKEYSDKLCELQSDNKDVFWKALKRIIEKSKEGHFRRIRDILGQKSLDHPGNLMLQVEYMAGCMQAYDEVLNLVEKNQNACDEAYAKIKEFQGIADKIKLNLSAQ